MTCVSQFKGCACDKLIQYEVYLLYFFLKEKKCTYCIYLSTRNKTWGINWGWENK